MDLHIDLNKSGRKSISRIDKKPKKKLTAGEKLILDLGLENFKEDLEKAGTVHLPEGAERFSYKTNSEYGVIHIPVNRLKQVYQTDKALNPNKVKENMEKMKANAPLEPVEIGYNYDVHDGHHRWEAAKKLGHTHVPCKVKGSDSEKVKEAKKRYREVWKSEIVDFQEGRLPHFTNEPTIKKSMEDGRQIQAEQENLSHIIHMNNDTK
ncbi:hypothetical protein [Bacillus phage SPO1L4]|uniref:Nuclease n=1 Tax=Bacillus phage vB_BsuM-Goe2 TaxID=1933062 RepID=A0A217EQI6_9CAUD|nr:nuclease [Bacillus phage vB_BsuM-Goe2]WIT26584.1 hypothetical protein [Bacillus phage SPO1L4]